MQLNDLREEDARTFAPEVLPRMREAVADLSLLIDRGYAEKATLALVGDRWSLDARQRIAVRRAAAGDRELELRARHRLERTEIAGRPIAIDGYNVLATVYCAKVGRAVLVGRDGCFRDLAALRGNFENAPLIEAARLVLATLADLAVPRATWWLDDPVSGSGELAAALRVLEGEVVSEAATAKDPDAVLIEGPEVCATSDSRVLEDCKGWLNLARWTIEDHLVGAYIVDLAKNL